MIYNAPAYASAYFHMDIIQVDPADKELVHRFLYLPFHIYKNTPQWVPPFVNG
jgi:hypothetical protein